MENKRTIKGEMYVADLLQQTIRLYGKNFAAVVSIVCIMHLPVAAVCYAFGLSGSLNNFLTGFADLAIAGAVLHFFEIRKGVLSSAGIGIRKWPRLFFINFAANLAILIGLILLIVPGIFLAVRFSLINPLIMFPGRNTPGDVISHSSYLVRTNKLFWPIFWSGIILIFGIFAVAMLIVLLLVLAILIMDANGLDGVSLLDSVYSDMVIDFLVALVLPLFAALSYAAYKRTQPLSAEADS